MPSNGSYAPFLAKSILFAGLSPDNLGEVAAGAHLRRIEDNAYFFHQGEHATVLYVLVEGHVKFTQLTAEGHAVMVRVIGPGEMFGAVAALGDALYVASAQASDRCTALGWSADEVNSIIERFPSVALNGIRFLAGRVQEFQDRYRELATERVERRVARALLRLAAQIGKQSERGVLIDFTLSRQDIAEMTGTTLFTVSRTLSAWEQQGLVEGGRERVLIRKPDKLLQIAEDLPPQTQPPR